MIHVAKALVGTSAALSPRALLKLRAQVKAMVHCLNCPGGPWDVGVMLTTDSHMQRLNRKFLQKDKLTDILSFPFYKVRVPGQFPRLKRKDERYLGDIYISPAYVQHQCETLQFDDVTTLEERLPVLMAHGLCHLLGYDHKRDDDYERMQQAENFILNHYAKFLTPAFTTVSIPASTTPTDSK